MAYKHITDIFFDLDHTLWDFDRNSKLAFGRMFKEYMIRLDLDEFMEIYGPINFNFWKMYREGVITKDELRKRRFTEVFEHFEMRFNEQLIVEMEAAYIKELPISNHLFPKAKETLEYLDGRYRLHIITNGFEEVQERKLLNSNIHAHFDTITTSDEAGNQKPHPDVFNLAMQKAKTIPDKSLMIGDTFEADILGAEGVGMQAIYFNYRKENIPEKFQKVDGLGELMEIL